MPGDTAIEWADATWNPVVGCAVVSPGCTNCYAMRQAARIERMGGKGGALYAGLTRPSKAGPVWTGAARALNFDHPTWTAPLRWRRPRRIFVNSMSDLFHEDVPDEAIDRAFAVMALSPRHTFQILTKRPERMRAYFADAETRLRIMEAVEEETVGTPREADAPAAYKRLRPGPLPNVWLGVSAERQAEADARIPLLLDTPAAVRFLSAEPLLGPIDALPYLFLYTREDDERLAVPTGDPLPFHDPATTSPDDVVTPRLDWVIVGGESGPNARPMHPDWARQLRDQCAAAAVPFFFKQWGEWAPETLASEHAESLELQNRHAWIDGQDFVRRGKPAAGRLLDGWLHHAFPGQPLAEAA